MKNVKGKLFLSMMLIIGLGIWYSPAVSQIRYDVDINVSEYDVLFLTEFFNIKSQKISSSVSGFSVDITERPPVIGAPAAWRSVCVGVTVEAKLRGDAGYGNPLVRGISRDFVIRNGHRTLTAYDFAGSGIASVDHSKEYDQDIPKRRRIADYAQTNPTAPPGTYQITVIVFDSLATNVRAAVLGKDTKTVVIPYSSVDEVFVEINDPKNGSFFRNLAPTFNWTSGEKDVRVSVFEAGTNHHSPQDVLTGGNPCLVWESYSDNINPRILSNTPALTSIRPQPQQKAAGFTGASLTYPSNAQRQLQENKAYVLQVEARVLTNRGPMMRPSRPVVFRISDDRVGKILDNFVNTLGEDASSEYLELRSDPTNWIYWSSYGDIMLDGVKQSEADLEIFLKELAGRKDIKVELEIENR